MKHEKSTHHRKCETMKPAAAVYSRISIEDQSKYSLPSQQKACRELAAKRSFSTPAAYQFVDDGGLSTVLDRPALTALRAAVRSGVIKAVFVYDLDRLSRKLGHQCLLLDEFDKYGCEVVFVSSPNESTADSGGRMALQMRGVYSEYEKERIRERTMRGSRERAKQGKAISAGYGYKLKADGKLVIDKKRAPVVVRIFKLTIAGRSAADVATALNADGIPSPSGGRWSRGSISALLKRRAYIGEVHYGKTTKAEPQQRRKPAVAGKDPATSSKATPPEQWIAIACPAILDRATWDAAQSSIDHTRTVRSGRPSLTYLLRGLLRCGQCGAALSGAESHSHHYYNCVGRNGSERRRYCGQRGIRVDVIEPQVWERTLKAVTDPAKIAELCNGHRLELEKQNEDHAAERRTLTASIAKLAKREFRARQAMLDADLADSWQHFRDDLKAILAERREQECRLEAIQPVPEAKAADFETICRAMQAAHRIKNLQQQRELLRSMISQIVVTGDHMDIKAAFDLPRALAVLGTEPDDVPTPGGITRNSQATQRQQIPWRCHPGGQACLLPQRPQTRHSQRMHSSARRKPGVVPVSRRWSLRRVPPGRFNGRRPRRNDGRRSLASHARLVYGKKLPRWPDGLHVSRCRRT